MSAEIQLFQASQQTRKERGFLYTKEYPTCPEGQENVLKHIEFIIQDTLQELQQILAEDFSSIQGLRLVVTELITNAIIHGNLEVESNQEAKRSLNFSSLVNEAAKNSKLQKRILGVSFCIKDLGIHFYITDQGKGISNPANEKDPQYSGRGNIIINKICNNQVFTQTSTNGTIVRAQFPLPQKDNNVIPFQSNK